MGIPDPDMSNGRVVLISLPECLEDELEEKEVVPQVGGEVEGVLSWGKDEVEENSQHVEERMQKKVLKQTDRSHLSPLNNEDGFPDIGDLVRELSRARDCKSSASGESENQWQLLKQKGSPRGGCGEPCLANTVRLCRVTPGDDHNTDPKDKRPPTTICTTSRAFTCGSAPKLESLIPNLKETGLDDDWRHAKGEGCETWSRDLEPFRTRCTFCNAPFEEEQQGKPAGTAHALPSKGTYGSPTLLFQLSHRFRQDDSSDGEGELEQDGPSDGEGEDTSTIATHYPSSSSDHTLPHLRGGSRFSFSSSLESIFSPLSAPLGVRKERGRLPRSRSMDSNLSEGMGFSGIAKSNTDTEMEMENLHFMSAPSNLSNISLTAQHLPIPVPLQTVAPLAPPFPHPMDIPTWPHEAVTDQKWPSGKLDKHAMNTSPATWTGPKIPSISSPTTTLQAKAELRETQKFIKVLRSSIAHRELSEGTKTTEAAAIGEAQEHRRESYEQNMKYAYVPGPPHHVRDKGILKGKQSATVPKPSKPRRWRKALRYDEDMYRDMMCAHLALRDSKDESAGGKFEIDGEKRVKREKKRVPWSINGPPTVDKNEFDSFLYGDCRQQ